MTRIQFIQSCSLEELAKIFCSIIDDVDYQVHEKGGIDIETCDYCPATEFCRIGHNGFLDWLLKEREKENE